MTGFHGEYQSTIDAKGRFLLPGSLKKQLAEGETHFIVSRGFEKCLTLYPIKSWQGILDRISQLNDFSSGWYTLFSLNCNYSGMESKLSFKWMNASFV